LRSTTWKDGALQTALFEPFQILRHSNQEMYRKEKEKAGLGRNLKIWLPGMDSNHEESTSTVISTLLILESPASPESPRNTAICTAFVHGRSAADLMEMLTQPADNRPTAYQPRLIGLRSVFATNVRISRDQTSLDQLHACFGSSEAGRRRSEQSRIRRQR
jgi:hypothetical protein